jgi:hypothetical protein
MTDANANFPSALQRLAEEPGTVIITQIDSRLHRNTWKGNIMANEDARDQYPVGARLAAHR